MLNSITRTKRTTAFGLAALAAFAPLSVFAQDLSYFNNAADSASTVIERLVVLCVAVALLVFLWGMVVFIARSDSDQERAAGRQKMVWGVIALFVIVSVWGIVALFQQITGVDGDVGPINAPGVPK